ncbi:TonB-dependent receptor domain-containing protein [Fulvivirgaceae bacterium LMO-SS25]
MMKKYLMLTLLLLVIAGSAWAQTASIKGKIVDAETEEPLIGVNLKLEGTSRGAVTDSNGDFVIANVPTAVYKLVATYVGYATFSSVVAVSTSDVDLGQISMGQTYLLGEEIVVSATRRPEKLTEAPAAISVITSRDLEELPSFNVGELLNKVQGVEVVRSGVIGIGINARGFNSAFNVRMFQMNDGRNGMLPGGTGLPAGFYNTIIKEDIERVEVILGPASALYGPNAHAGVVNTITKDPRASEGTTVVLGAGNQNVLSTRLRHAQVLNDKLAFKANFEYTKGTDFEFVDSVYVNNVGVPELDPNFDFESLRFGSALYYSVNDDADIIVDYGFGRGSNIGVTNLGRNQIEDWTFSYLHGRYVSPRIFAQVYNTWNDAGNTIQINGRTTNYYTLLAQGKTQAEARELSTKPVSEGGVGFPGFIDNSSRLNGEVQYNNNYEGFNFIVGASFQRDQAFSDGTYLYDVNGDIIINQFGGVVQVEKDLTNNLKFTGAARVDKHDYYGTQFSPRLALTMNGAGGTFRTTYGRAYAAPSIQFLEFLFPFAGGAIIGSGQGLTVQEFSQSLITGETTLGATREIDPLQPESVQTVEFGYKGSPAKNVFFDGTLWYSASRDFVSPAVSLFAVNNQTFAIEGEKIIARGDTPIPAEYGNLHITYLNFGQVNSWGADFGVNIGLNDNYSIGVKYSYFDSDITDDDKFEDDENLQRVSPAVRESLRYLNAAQNRFNFNFSARNLMDDKLFASLNVRVVPEFDFRSGQQIATAAGANSRVPGSLYNYGPLGGFTSVDLSAGYQISDYVSFGAGVSNLFDVDQREFVGSPMIGRLFSAELKLQLPPIKRKN